MVLRQRAAATLPVLMQVLRKKPLKPNSMAIGQRLPSLRRAFSLYDQINLIDNVPEDQLRFQGMQDGEIESLIAQTSRVTSRDVLVGGTIDCIREAGPPGALLILKLADFSIDCLKFGYTDTGFTVNGVDYEGSLICVGNLLMSWSPKKFSEVNAESLSIFNIMRPIPDILVLGCGKYIQPVKPELRQFIRSTGMKLEAIDSRNAASTYNILNEEGRIVAAALLPYGVED